LTVDWRLEKYTDSNVFCRRDMSNLIRFFQGIPVLQADAEPNAQARYSIRFSHDLHRTFVAAEMSGSRREVPTKAGQLHNQLLAVPLCRGRGPSTMTTDSASAFSSPRLSLFYLLMLVKPGMHAGQNRTTNLHEDFVASNSVLLPCSSKSQAKFRGGLRGRLATSP
jgi:hypothetical protein